MRFAIVVMVLFLALWFVLIDELLTDAYGRDLAWEAWEENAPIGSASEGAHAWVTRGLYERSLELGMNRWEAAGTAMGTMLLWEIIEVRGMDAEGVSVQDIVGNGVGLASGLVGLDLHFSYASHIDPPERDDKAWLNVPAVPMNDLTYGLEIAYGGWAVGYKYMADPGDLVIGSTTMPVHGGEHGSFTAVPYVGYEWKSGWHAAGGLDHANDEIMAGGGYRWNPWGVGIDLTGLLHGDEMTFGASFFAEFGSVF